ncbi:uncharacterized protein DDB_G0271670-like [Herrania umbratica]|uniref:Uncharacterized protein DDB_G0271670-like n=1 Tax=Herrania umbratica TaxID=108875 RepID=A0A6J1B3W9_9ROSI|nr:uncharacterized protein DDB_G0271670-like [Herrania umbratica]
MPSGAKKRKAAKKKKEQAANNINSSTNNSPHGNDDPKSQDERDSDGGDVGSSASQDDQNHQNAFSQGEEEGRSAPSSVQSYVTEDKSVEEATRDAESTEKLGLDDVVAVKNDKELEPEDMESTRVIIQHIEHDKSSSSSSRSSSSSSDDESEASEKKSKEEAFNFVPEATSYNIEDKSATIMSEKVAKVAENETLGDVDGNSAVETAAVDNLVKPVLSMPEEVDHAVEFSIKKSVVSDVVESGLKESEEKLLPSSNGFSRDELEGNEGKIFPLSSTSTAESSNVAEKVRDSGTPDYSEKQPLVASTPPVVQKTSVLSCCGLFDVFTGSGR